MIHRSLGRLEDQPVAHDPTISKRVLLTRGELPGLANFSQAVFKPGDLAPRHSHAGMWEVFFVRSGTGKIRVEGREAGLLENECWVIAPGEEHEIENDGEADLVLLYFGLDPTAGMGEALEQERPEGGG